MHEIMHRLNEYGYKSYIVGGAVRDYIMQIPINDIDIAVQASPEQLKKVFPQSPFVGESYGILLVDGVEVAPFRCDAVCDGRQATPEFNVNLIEDLSRRDFTINAMAIDINGQLHDPFDGQADILNKLVKFVGNPEDRLAEDYLRAIRAVRFASRFKFSLDDNTYNAIKANANVVAESVAGERVLAEMKKANEFFADFICLLLDTNLLFSLFPDIARLDKCEQDPKWHPEGDVLAHTIIALLLLDNDAKFETKLATLFHDIGKPETKGVSDSGRIINHSHDSVGSNITRHILRRLGASNKFVNDVSWLVRYHMAIHSKDLTKKGLRRLRRQQSDELIEELFKVAFADSGSCIKPKKVIRDSNNYQMWKEVLAEPEKPKDFISGREIMDIFGVKEGPEIGRLKNAANEYVLGLEDIPTKDEVIAFLRSGME